MNDTFYVWKHRVAKCWLRDKYSFGDFYSATKFKTREEAINYITKLGIVKTEQDKYTSDIVLEQYNITCVKMSDPTIIELDMPF
jgi:hypothetical protein